MGVTAETVAVEGWVGRAVGRVCRQHARNLYIASFFLPPRKRAAMQAVGAFVHLLEEAIPATTEVQPAQNPLGACSSASDVNQRVAMVSKRLEAIHAGDVPVPSEPADDSAAV